MGIEFPIKYGVKVNDVGNVHGDSMPKLLEYRNKIRNRANVNGYSEFGPLGPAAYSPITGAYK